MLQSALPPLPLIVRPAAFTYITGNAYCETLLRAGAIENQCYVLASVQGGKYPLGDIKSLLVDGEGLVSSVIDPQFICGSAT